MSKFLTILVILTLSLSSCSNNEDEPKQVPPVNPQPKEEVSLDALVGTWETIYYKKYLTVNPGTAKQESFGDLRIIDYDGFKTQFWKENGVYKFRSLNIFNEVIGQDYKEEGTYSLTANKDSIKFTWPIRVDKDTVTYQKIREYGVYAGVMTNEKDFLGRTSDGTQYRVTDIKMSRKIEEAPTATGNINPVKEKLDFEDLSNGSWEIYRCLVFYDGKINNTDSKIMGDTLVGTTYKFFTNSKGQKRCYIKERNPDNFDKWVTNEFAVTLVDDLIIFEYKDEKGKTNAIWMWVNSRQKRDGMDSFIDRTQNRLSSNIRVVYVQDSYLRRVPD